jgi:type VI secretion system FHA domain protein
VFDVIKNGKNRSKVKSFRFDQKGGVLGRSDDANYKLTDPQNYISGKHLYIEYRNGKYYAKDESVNGTFLKYPYRKLEKGAPYLINSSDVFIIGDHELQARFLDEEYDGDHIEKTILGEPEPIEAVKELIPDDFLNEAALYDGFGKKAPDDDTPIDIINALDGDKNMRSLLENEDSEAVSDAGEIGGADNRLNEHFDIPRFSKERRQTVAPRSSVSEDDEGAAAALRVLEDGLDIEILSLEPERRKALLMELSNLILEMLGGLNASLRVKERIREEMRLPAANKRDNNPIKLGRSASHLLQNAEIGERLGLMRLSEAVAKSFAEIDAHMIALHGASKNALETAASAFTPKNLEYKFESAGALKGFGTRSGLAWRAYCKMFENLDGDPSLGVEIIMPHFVKAYERLLFSINLATMDGV